MSERLPVIFTRRASKQVNEAAKWWRENREKAPEALREELEHALDLIASSPQVGVAARNVRLAGVRRVLLSSIHYHLYYRFRPPPNPLIEVLAFWHARRGSAPHL